VEHADYVDVVARETDALGAALEAGPLSAAVPTCPGWTLADLARHVGEFCGFWTHVLCEGTGRLKTPFPPVPEGDERRNWLAQLAQLLVQGLQATPPETPVWTWYEPDQSAAFVARRCANELAVHRYDAQSARATPEPIDRALAVDGIDEMVTRLVLTCDRSGQASGQTIHLHGTDDDASDEPPAEWLLTLQPDRVDSVRQHAKGDLALRGSASDLELLLYGRPTVGPVERLGDESVLDAWYREFSF
jgi:uncharacterized protein (TIGR03083 family)